MITIKEIAELAGVSRGTVDRVVNNRGGVNESVHKRIHGIIEKHGFKPNRVARALVRRQKLYTIGMISATVENVFFRDVVAGMERATVEVKDFGVSLVFREVAKFSVADQIRCIEEMLALGIDGLAINPINDDEVRKKLREVTARGIPIITFNSDIEGVDRLAYIGCDYRKTGRIAAGLIAISSRGRANVAIVTGSMKSLGHCMRIEGFRSELERYPEMNIVETGEMFDDENVSYAVVKDLLRRNDGIDAFFFSAGGKEGGIRAILERRADRLPRIVTVDLDPFIRGCLKDGVVESTVCQQPFVQGYEPIRQLANYLMLGDPPAREVQYTQAEIVIKQSLESES